MNDPAEVVINMSASIVAKMKASFPEFLFWHEVKGMSSTSALLELWVADHHLPSFASVEVACEVLDESYRKRVLSLRTCSAQWSEDLCPDIMAAEDTIDATLKEEYERESRAPIFAFTTLHLCVGVRRRVLQVKFLETSCEFDAATEQVSDYDSLSRETVQDIEAIHRILLWIKTPHS